VVEVNIEDVDATRTIISKSGSKTKLNKSEEIGSGLIASVKKQSILALTSPQSEKEKSQ